jgi:O-acetyl-ADP-ribose deacetylase (regulator of RNase III)
LCAEQMDMNHNTIVDWNKYLRELGGYKLQQTTLIIGGPGVAVEIDESVFKKSRNRVCLPAQKWMLGGICLRTEEVSFIQVPDRCPEGRAIALRASRRGNPGLIPGLVMGVCGGQSGTGRDRFSPSTSVSHANSHSTNSSTSVDYPIVDLYSLNTESAVK